MIYSFELEKYFIMEDGCEKCEQDYRSGRYRIDIWTGCAQVFLAVGRSQLTAFLQVSLGSGLRSCEAALSTEATPVCSGV